MTTNDLVEVCFSDMWLLRNDEIFFKNEIKLVGKRGTKEFEQGQKMKKK